MARVQDGTIRRCTCTSGQGGAQAAARTLIIAWTPDRRALGSRQSVSRVLGVIFAWPVLCLCSELSHVHVSAWVLLPNVAQGFGASPGAVARCHLGPLSLRPHV